MPLSYLAPPLGHGFSILASALDPRPAPRLACLPAGALRAKRRRTVTRWIRASGLSAEYRSCYTVISAAGRRAEGIAARLVSAVLKPLLRDTGRVVRAWDDTPTQR